MSCRLDYYTLPLTDFEVNFQAWIEQTLAVGGVHNISLAAHVNSASMQRVSRYAPFPVEGMAKADKATRRIAMPQVIIDLSLAKRVNATRLRSE
jgi:hypothetical protein